MARVYGTQKYSIENLLQQQAQAQFEDYLKQAKKGSYKAPSKRGSGDQSWLSSIISELGGAGGAAGGAAIGAGIGSVVPGIGTAIGGLIGAGLGGFAGGTGGRLLENQVRDNEYRVGDALKEGLLSGALSAAIPGGKALASGGKAIVGKGGLKMAGQEATKSLEKSFANAGTGSLGRRSAKLTGKALGKEVIPGTFDDSLRGGIQGLGDGTRGWVRGIKAGYKDGNIPLEDDVVKSVNRAIDKATKGKLAFSPSQQFKAVSKAAAKEIDNYGKTPEAAKTFTSKSSQKIIDSFKKKIYDNPNLRGNLTKKQQNTVDNIINDINGLAGKSNEEALETIARINSNAGKYIGNPNAPVSGQIWESARQAAKQLIDKDLSTKSASNKGLSDLLTAKSLLSSAVTRTERAAQGNFNVGTGVRTALMPGLDTAGRVIQTVGRATTPYAKGMGATGANLVRQAPGNLAEAFNTPTPTQDPMQNMSPEDQALMAAYEKFSQENPEQAMNYNPLGEMQGGIPGMDQQSTIGVPGMYEDGSPMGDPQMTGQGGDMPQQSGMTKDQLQQMVMQDFAQTGGKNVTKLISLYEVLKAETPTSGGTLNSTAAGVVADTTTGLNALKQLSQDVSQSDANAPGIGWLRSKNPYDTNAQNLQAKIATTKQIVGKALEGGVLRKEDEIKYAKILPTLNDTDAVAQYKINALIDLISQRLNEYQSNIQGGTTSDLSNIMSQYQ